MHNDPDTIARAVQLRRMTREFLAEFTPQERARMLRLHMLEATRAVKDRARLTALTDRIAERVRQRIERKRSAAGETRPTLR